MDVTIIDYANQRKIKFKNNAKGIRDFINLLNKTFYQNSLDNIRIIYTYTKKGKINEN